jgi:hypothetical protein
MEGISDAVDRLDRIMNYINSIRIYCEKNKDTLQIEDLVKQLNISIDNIYILLAEIYYSMRKFKDTKDMNSIIEYLKECYVLSEKCIEKIVFIDRLCKKISRSNNRDIEQLKMELPKIIDTLEDIVDELSDYLMY